MKRKDVTFLKENDVTQGCAIEIAKIKSQIVRNKEGRTKQSCVDGITSKCKYFCKEILNQLLEYTPQAKNPIRSYL